MKTLLVAVYHNSTFLSSVCVPSIEPSNLLSEQRREPNPLSEDCKTFQ